MGSIWLYGISIFSGLTNVLFTNYEDIANYLPNNLDLNKSEESTVSCY